jgi:hypothetical protein
MANGFWAIWMEMGTEATQGILVDNWASERIWSPEKTKQMRIWIYSPFWAPILPSPNVEEFYVFPPVSIWHAILPSPFLGLFFHSFLALLLPSHHLEPINCSPNSPKEEEETFWGACRININANGQKRGECGGMAPEGKGGWNSLNAVVSPEWPQMKLTRGIDGMDGWGRAHFGRGCGVAGRD